MAHQLRLISFDTCPFVERSRIVLEEKHVPYDLALIDLKQKPDWFLAISPMGKVPVLVVDGQPVFESAVINELLDELYPESALLPAEPLARADARAWIVYCNDALMPQTIKVVFGTDAERLDALDLVAPIFQRLNAELEKRGGAYFMGDSFGLVDAVYAPFFNRFAATEDPRCAALLDRYPALARYATNLMTRGSVLRAKPTDLAAKQRRTREERSHHSPSG